VISRGFSQRKTADRRVARRMRPIAPGCPAKIPRRRVEHDIEVIAGVNMNVAVD
jgi:hypothetical protein